MQLQQIFLYPIKSTIGYGVNQALVQPQGLNFDREFMLCEPNGKFISARKDGELYNFSAFPVPQGLYIQHKDGSSQQVQYQDFQQLQTCEVWGNEFASWLAPAETNLWFSQKLGRDVQLRWLGANSQRRLKRFPEHSLSFADGYPLLLTNQNSLTELQQHCPTPVQMAQFRPNLVIEGEQAFFEQQWDQVRIGEVEFLHVKPCVRCVLTARNPDNGQMDQRMEPFRTLKKLNVNEKGEPLFGVNLLPLNSGIIRLGDKLEVLSYK